MYKGFDTALGFYTEYFEAFDKIAFDIERITTVDDWTRL